ncbi:MAG: hypothetical protein AB7R89_11155 [Dehalococcoidia bacterium]
MSPIEDEAIAIADAAVRAQWAEKWEQLDQAARLVIGLRKSWDTMTSAFTTLWQEMEGVFVLSDMDQHAPNDTDEGPAMRIALAAQLLGLATFWQPEDFADDGEGA